MSLDWMILWREVFLCKNWAYSWIHFLNAFKSSKTLSCNLLYYCVHTLLYRSFKGCGAQWVLLLFEHLTRYIFYKGIKHVQGGCTVFRAAHSAYNMTSSLGLLSAWGYYIWWWRAVLQVAGRWNLKVWKGRKWFINYQATFIKDSIR